MTPFPNGSVRRLDAALHPTAGSEVFRMNHDETKVVFVMARPFATTSGRWVAKLALLDRLCPVETAVCVRRPFEHRIQPFTARHRWNQGLTFRGAWAKSLCEMPWRNDMLRVLVLWPMLLGDARVCLPNAIPEADRLPLGTRFAVDLGRFEQEHHVARCHRAHPVGGGRMGLCSRRLPRFTCTYPAFSSKKARC